MKIKYLQLALLLIVLLGVTSCSEDKLGSSVITIPEEPTSPIDTWIRGEITNPHNVEILYKWKDVETDLGKNLVPPREDVVLPFLEVIKKVWIDVYVEIAGKDFFNRLTPKQILLIGSANFNNDGTITQGTAEAGRKIVLYEVNDFTTENLPKFLRFFHVIHHEFAHITHQNVMFDESIYGNITPGGYRSDWQNETDAIAKSQGFISQYARLNPNEDFVEMVATMLTTTREQWDATIDGAGAGTEALRTKEEFVVSYYMTEWNIDLYKFQERMAEVIAEVTEQ